jgi:hypothetical protein
MRVASVNSPIKSSLKTRFKTIAVYFKRGILTLSAKNKSQIWGLYTMVQIRYVLKFSHFSQIVFQLEACASLLALIRSFIGSSGMFSV